MTLLQPDGKVSWEDVEKGQRDDCVFPREIFRHSAR